MLSEKKELSKISVSELTKRANINRGTFYTHYDDIYGVAEDYENELINEFFDNDTLLSANNFPKFLDSLFKYMKENDGEYRLLCRSDDFISVMKRLISLAENKLLELCHNDKRLKDKSFLSVEINVFVEGILIQYIKYCRGQSSVTPGELPITPMNGLQDSRKGVSRFDFGRKSAMTDELANDRTEGQPPANLYIEY